MPLGGKDENMASVLLSCACVCGWLGCGGKSINAAGWTVFITNNTPDINTVYNNGALVEASGATTSTITLASSQYQFSFTANTITFTNPYPPGGYRAAFQTRPSTDSFFNSRTFRQSQA
jgi:hypothetical protein